MDNPILVTGAGRRVGFHIASRLHQDGYEVLAHYRTETDDVQKLRQSGIQTIQADLQDTSQHNGVYCSIAAGKQNISRYCA